MSFIQPQQTQCSVQVIIRLQPPQSQHLQLIDHNTLYCINKQYYFDYIFPHHSTQQHIYEQVGMKMIASARKGYNSCIFAYGQTGSGKTYTMTGNYNQDGLIQKCMINLWKILENFQTYQLKLSYFQIYNEQVNDLLVTNSTGKKKQKQKANIKIKQSLTLGFYLQNLQQIKIQNQQDLIQNLEKGIKNRTTAQTKMNRQSSRSHSILTLFVNTRERKQNSMNFSIKSFKMHFVDLAGSQKQKSTLAVGQRLKQASNINKSLTSLSIVIQKLSTKATHIPYRDSVLTKILRDSLGGNSKTILIATLSSRIQSMSQTISTLNFATKAKKVKQSGSAIEMRRRIQQLQHQIKCLRFKQLQPIKCNNCQYLQQENTRFQAQMDKMDALIRQKQSKIISLQQMLMNLQIQYQNKLTNSYNKIQQLQNLAYSHNQIPTQYHNYFHTENKTHENNKLYQQPQRQYIIIDQDQQSNAYINKYTNGLSVIMEQNAQNQMSSISPPTDCPQKQISTSNNNNNSNSNRDRDTNRYRDRDANRYRYTKTSKPNKTTIQQLKHSQQSILSRDDEKYRLKLQYIKCLKTIKGLKQQIIVLQNQQWNLQQQVGSIKRQQIHKQQQQKNTYQPIIKKWIKQNGNIIKNNLRSKNSIQTDIILGMKNIINTLKNKITQCNTILLNKQNKYKNVIQELIKINDQYNANLAMCYGNQANDQKQSFWLDNYLQQDTCNLSAFLSKSHPRIQTNHSRVPNITVNIKNNKNADISSQIIDHQQGNISINKQNYTIRSAPQQKTQPTLTTNHRIQKLQQQLDKQQLLKQQLTREVQNYKLKWGQLQTQLQENRQLAQYWQNQYTMLSQAKKLLEQLLQKQIKQKQQQVEDLIVKKQQDKYKLQSQLDNINKTFYNYYNEYQEKMFKQNKNYQEKEQFLRDEVNHLQTQLNKYKQEKRKINQKNLGLENKISMLQNVNYNLTTEVDNLKKVNQKLINDYNSILNKNKLLDKQLDKITVQSRISQSNVKIMKQQYQRKQKSQQNDLNKLQKQNEKNYKEWLNQLDENKILKLKNKNLKQQLQKEEKRRKKLQQLNNDLNNIIQEEQSDSCKNYQKINQQKSQLQANLQRLQYKFNYLSKQFQTKVSQVKYWKQQSQKNKKWKQNFKKMQQQFINNKNQQINPLDRNNNTNKPRYQQKNKQKQQINRENNNSRQLNLNKQWEYKQSKRIIQQIVQKLSVVLGLEITTSNIILQLDEIYDKIQQSRIILQENKILRQKNKLLIQNRDRNSGSDFWNRFS